MGNSMHNTNTIDFNAAKLLAAEMELKQKQEECAALRWKLNTLLQTTLDIEKILHFFFEEIKQVVDLKGVIYANNAHNYEHKIGRKATHSCGYRLVTQQSHLGEICFYNSKRFKESQLETLEILLGSLITPLRNALDYTEACHAALTDALTGAGNRIALDNVLEREIDLAKRHGGPLSILVLDVDGFKEINDHHGHSSGDKVLKELVKCTEKATRKTDVCFRFGGDEFVVVLNKTDLEGALVISERLKKAVQSAKLKAEDGQFTFSVSIGVTSLKKRDDMHSLFERADKAMLKAKKQGKNHINCF